MQRLFMLSIGIAVTVTFTAVPDADAQIFTSPGAAPYRTFRTTPRYRTPSNFNSAPTYRSNVPVYQSPGQTYVPGQTYSSGYRGGYSTPYPSNFPASNFPASTYPNMYVAPNSYYGPSIYGNNRPSGYFGNSYYGTPAQQRGTVIGGAIGNSIGGQQSRVIGSAIGGAIGAGR